LGFVPQPNAHMGYATLTHPINNCAYLLIGEFKPIPDLAIEVVFTSGGPNKLARYKALGVPEVWFWEDGLFSLHNLRSADCDRIDRSQLEGLKYLDINLLTRCILMAQTSKVEAVRTFRRSI
jgi:Uma2 family endonuclease